MYRSVQDLDLTLLLTFKAFAARGSVQATAETLGRTQPAISTRLRALEDQFGAPLFERAGRRLQLTPVGRRLSAEIERLLPDLQRIADLGRQSEESLLGTLKVGALPTAGLYRLLPRLPELRSRHPGLQLELAYGDVTALSRKLRDGQLDLVLGVGSPPKSELSVTQLERVRPVRVTRRTGSTPNEWIAYGPADDPFFDAVWSYMQARGWTRRVTIVIAHIQSLKSLVRMGLGRTILPDYTVVESDLKCEPLSGFDRNQWLWCATRPALCSSPAVQAVVEALRRRKK